MRRARILLKGAQYHVSARVNNKELLLDPIIVKELFQEVIIRAKKKFSFTVENFVIMNNHFHMLITPGGNEDLSKIMQWIMSVFAMTYNRQFHRTGHFWGERFFSRIIGSVLQYIKTFMYIDDNPRRAGLVTENGDWRFGGLYHHRCGRKDIIADISWITRLLFPRHLQLALPHPTN